MHLHAHVYTLRVQVADGRRFRDIRFANEDADKISFYNRISLYLIMRQSHISTKSRAYFVKEAEESLM